MNCDQAICISENQNGLAEMAAETFVSDALQSVRQRGLFFVALSGGSTPRDMHRLLIKGSLAGTHTVVQDPYFLGG